MNNHTHNIIVSTLLSTHAPLIYKHDPTPNPSFPIYQNLVRVTKKIDNWQLMKKLDYSTARFYRRV
jgi:hypothetical protein